MVRRGRDVSEPSEAVNRTAPAAVSGPGLILRYVPVKVVGDLRGVFMVHNSLMWIPYHERDKIIMKMPLIAYVVFETVLMMLQSVFNMIEYASYADPAKEALGYSDHHYNARDGSCKRGNITHCIESYTFCVPLFILDSAPSSLQWNVLWAITFYFLTLIFSLIFFSPPYKT